MGLDMYLEKRQYVKNYDWEDSARHHEIVVKKGGKVQESPFPLTNLIYEVGYWRKANAIHKWFVDNCAGGEDNCQDVYVPHEKLQELLNLCKTVKDIAVLEDEKVTNGYSYYHGVKTPILEDGKTVVNAEEIARLLPTTDGFFFGGTDYDEYYFNDCAETVRIIESLLKEDNTSADFEYHSSW